MEGDAATSSSPPISADAEIRRLDEKIGLLTAAVYNKRPWYRDVSSIVSLAAFAISLLTTLFAAYHGYRQDVEGKRNQLHTALNQINSTNMQEVEATIKFKNEPFLSQITSSLNGQNVLAAKQAYSLVVSLGSAATAPDLLAVSAALGALNEVTLSEKLLDSAKARIENVVEYMAVYRQLGSVKLYNREIGEGNAAFQKAADVFSAYPKDANNSEFVFITNFSTQIQWAGALLSVDCRSAGMHANQAQALLDEQSQRGSQNPILGYMKADLDRLRASLSNCR